MFNRRTRGSVTYASCNISLLQSTRTSTLNPWYLERTMTPEKTFECLEGHKNPKCINHDTYGKNLCLECWYNHGWVTVLREVEVDLDEELQLLTEQIATKQRSQLAFCYWMMVISVCFFLICVLIFQGFK